VFSELFVVVFVLVVIIAAVCVGGEIGDSHDFFLLSQKKL
jgi:hypothetical protein